MGEVLYLTISQNIPKYGYVLTKGLPEMKGKDSHNRDVKSMHAGAAKDSGGAAGAGQSERDDVIDLLDDDSSDDESDAAPPPPRCATPSGHANFNTSGEARGENVPRTREEDCEPPVNESVKQGNDEGKGTADDPCELLSSDDEEVIVQHDSKPERAAWGRSRGGRVGKARGSAGRAAAGARAGRGRGRQRQKPQQSERDEQRQQQQQPPQGAGPSGQQHSTEDVVSMYSPPAPAHPDDTPAVLASRNTVMAAWKDLCRAQDSCKELLEILKAKQANYQEIASQAGAFGLERDVAAVRQQHTARLNLATAAVHTCLMRYNSARTAVVVAAAQYKRTSDDLGAAVAVMLTERRAAAEQRRGEKIASQFQAEVKAWDLVEQTSDLNILSAGELKRIATAMGVEVTGCVEKADLASAITAKRESGRETWLARKKRRAAEEEIAARQRRKLAELREEESKRQAAESAQAGAKQRAAAKVAAWAHNADLRLFLQRCGIAVDAGAGNSKKSLTTAYRRAMMKFHPDRTRGASAEQQALASEVTKWITQAWQALRD